MQSEPQPPPSVPEEVLAASHAALDLHDPSLPVAMLRADSLLDAEVPLPDGADRRLIFGLDDLYVDVILWRDPGESRMLVCVGREAESEAETAADATNAGGGPAGYDHLELVQPPSRTTVALSAGEARRTGVSPGLTSLVLSGPVGSSVSGVRTAWFRI
jgi:hypothetical protein